MAALKSNVHAPAAVGVAMDLRQSGERDEQVINSTTKGCGTGQFGRHASATSSPTIL
jgi:hypothetical protein